jgi:hypothetical protein
VKVVAVNFKVNTEIGLFPASVKSTEVIVSDVVGHLPVSLAAKFVRNRFGLSWSRCNEQTRDRCYYF